MKAVILNIGDELLIGDTINTNASFMANSLDDAGISVKYVKVIADEKQDIVTSLDELDDEIGIVLITGGLGPTHDDITKHTLCEYFKDSLIHNEEVLEDVRSLLERFGKTMNALNEGQAMLPSRCEVVRNFYGTAPGMIFRENGKFYVSMPGVPTEMKRMMKNSIIPSIQKFSSNGFKFHEHIKTFGEAESNLAVLLNKEIEELHPEVKLAFLPSPGTVKLRLTISGDNEEEMRNLLDVEKKKFTERLGDLVYGFSGDQLETVIGDLLREQQLTIATAESCTGGLLASKITSVPGSSEYFLGSVIAYSNDVKVKELNVDDEVLNKHGAVSEEVVLSMAEGARKKFNADVALSTSGIAGPDGGTEEKPVGTIWIGLSFKEKSQAKLIKLRFNRRTNIDLTAKHCLDLLRKELLKNV